MHTMSDIHPTTVIGNINKTFTPFVMGEADSNIRFRITEFKRLFYYWLIWKKYWELGYGEEVEKEEFEFLGGILVHKHVAVVSQLSMMLLEPDCKEETSNLEPAKSFLIYRIGSGNNQDSMFFYFREIIPTKYEFTISFILLSPTWEMKLWGALWALIYVDGIDIWSRGVTIVTIDEIPEGYKEYFRRKIGKFYNRELYWSDLLDRIE